MLEELRYPIGRFQWAGESSEGGPPLCRRPLEFVYPVQAGAYRGSTAYQGVFRELMGRAAGRPRRSRGAFPGTASGVARALGDGLGVVKRDRVEADVRPSGTRSRRARSARRAVCLAWAPPRQTD